MREKKTGFLSNIYFISKSLCCFIALILIILINNNPKITNENKVQNYQKNQNTTYNFINKKLYWKNQTSLEIDKVREEIKNYEKFQISFENEKDFIKRDHPKVSIVITLYNQKKYIKLIYSSIQKQELKDIEIIFVDDASIDNSSIIIDELMGRDKRIIYLKNDINRLAFYSRNKGVLEAKGEYILVIDPDDLLVNNILLKAYETAKEYNLDIVQFYIIKGTFNYSIVWDKLKYRNGILYNNSDIRKIFYYGETRNLVDKLVRKEVYIKSINFMRKDLYYEDYHVNDDDTAFFGLIHFANSYGFLEQIGYFYLLKSNGNYGSRLDRGKMNSIFRSKFNIMKYFYLQSDNNTLEKINMPFKYFQMKVKNKYEKYIIYLTDEFEFILDVLNLFLNSTYFNNQQKFNIARFKNKIIDRKNQFKGSDHLI